MTDNLFQLPIINMTEEGKYKLIKIKLDQLPPNEVLLSPNPTRELIEDISIRGQTTPIQVTLDANGNYIVIAGRRRIKALRALHEAMPDKWTTVNAILIETPLDAYSILGFASVENNLRTENPLTDLQAIKYLMDNNPQISEQEISRQTGIPIARIRKRLKLNKLIPEIAKAVINGDIAISVAEETTKLNHSKQEQLLNIFLEKGKISKEDVIDVQRAVVQENANTLPDFPDIDTLTEEEDICGYAVITHLDTFLTQDLLTIEQARELKGDDKSLQICKVIAME